MLTNVAHHRLNYGISQGPFATHANATANPTVDCEIGSWSSCFDSVIDIIDRADNGCH